MRSITVAVACWLVLAGCGGVPVGVKRLDPRVVNRNLTANVISAGEPSHATRNALERRNLSELFAEKPAEALEALHEIGIASFDADTLFALAELSFLEGDRSGNRAWHRASALYAWTFLFGGTPPERFDPRLRIAAELYNRGLTEGFSVGDGEEVELRSGVYDLPFGELEVEFEESSLQWNGRRLRQFIPVAELEVFGLESRFRRSGIGAPLAASAAVENPDESTEFVAPRLKIPVTALLRVENPFAQIASAAVRAKLELYSDPYAESVEVGGRRVPLESEQTAAIAAMLTDLPLWKQELATFIGSVSPQTAKGRLIALRPHRPGSIPVVFVHGTNSSPGRWAEMVNVLDADGRIHERFEPWFFFYSSGAPVAYSAYLLRKALTEVVATIDSAGSDECLRNMVVIGHSQGGLLTKMTAIDSGDRFWTSVSDKPFEEVRGLSDEQRAIVRDMAFMKPLPFVKRVVFVATPHGGSFLAAGSLVRGIIARIVSLPSTVGDVTRSAMAGDPNVFKASDITSMTAIDNMSPRHRFIRNLSGSPIAPGVAAHSIIAVDGDGPIEEGDDGVVAYSSAHIEGVESEKVVRSAHSTQSHPETIEEVRRILLLHAEPTACGR